MSVMTNVTVPVGKAAVEAVASTRSDIGIGDRNHPQGASGRPTPAADGGEVFGEEIPVPADAPASERPAGWVGRDLHWAPPETRD